MSLTTPDRAIAPGPTGSFRIVETDPAADPRWMDFILSHPKGSVYHHPAWLKALSKEYPQRALHLACESEDGRFLAVLPLIQTRGLPCKAGGAQAGRRLSSLPRTPLAGLLSTDRHASVAIVRAALGQVRRRPRLLLQIKTDCPELDGLVDGLSGSPWRNSYLLTLRREEPFRISDGPMRSRIRWAVKKAATLGVVVRPAETQSELRAWYALYLDTMRSNALPPRSYRFFAALWEILKPLGILQLLVAEHQQGGGARIIAGSVFLRFGGTVSYAFNGSRRADLSLRPNDAILWRAINEAWADGYQAFDLGEVPEGNKELAQFKSKWGAQPVRLYRYHSGITETGSAADYPSTRAIALLQAAWRRLPLKVTEWAGDRIYRYL